MVAKVGGVVILCTSCGTHGIDVASHTWAAVHMASATNMQADICTAVQASVATKMIVAI